MSSSVRAAPALPRMAPTRTRDRVRKALLACGPWSALSYIGWHEAAALRVIGVLMLLPTATFPLWALFGEASLAAHIGLVLIGIGTWLGAMACGAVAFGKRFRIYSLATLAVVVVPSNGRPVLMKP